MYLFFFQFALIYVLFVSVVLNILYSVDLASFSLSLFSQFIFPSLLPYFLPPPLHIFFLDFSTLSFRRTNFALIYGQFVLVVSKWQIRAGLVVTGILN